MTKHQVQVRGVFGGTVGNWRPAITGTLNQTGGSDEEASTFEFNDSEGAREAANLVIAEGALPEDVRIVGLE